MTQSSWNGLGKVNHVWVLLIVTYFRKQTALFNIFKKSVAEELTLSSYRIHYNILEKKTHRILGIDPGTNFLGYAVLEIEGRNLNLVTMSILTLTHVDEPSEKLKRIFEKVAWVIDTYKPVEMAIEEPFYAKNVQSMLKLGRAQGVAMAAAMVNGLPVAQYLPKTVKKSVVGNGNASKEQVAAMLGHILKRPIEPSYFDASDALAVAVCHHYQSNSAFGGGKKHSSWASFVKDNANKIKK